MTMTGSTTVHEPTYWTEYEPGDGYRYVVAVSPLPKGSWGLGGQPDSHVLVTLFVPMAINATSYVLQRDGFLHESYLDDKFELPANVTIRENCVNAIREALGR